MKLAVSQIFVDDQQKALDYYTDVLGFEKKNDVPLGEYRWLTVVSREDLDGIEILLEPSSHAAVPPFKAALVKDNIPYKVFNVVSVEDVHKRLTAKGVKFITPPTDAGPVIIAVFDDTCGNLIQLNQMK